MQSQAATGIALFDLIAGIDARVRPLATRLPQPAPPVERWVGILFRVGERLLLTPLDQIAEVLGVPEEVTPLPGTAQWVLGVANNRGTLLPIFHLNSLIHGGVPTRRDADRLMVVREEGLPCGLVASEVIGIRRFAVTARLADLPTGLGVLRPFARAAFLLDDAAVPVIALDQLLADPLMSLGSV